MLVLDFNPFCDVGDNGVRYMATGSCTEQETLVAHIASASDHGPVGNRWNSKWHTIRCYVRTIITVELTATVACVLTLDGEPELAFTMVPLVPVEAVVTTEHN